MAPLLRAACLVLRAVPRVARDIAVLSMQLKVNSQVGLVWRVVVSRINRSFSKLIIGVLGAVPAETCRDVTTGARAYLACRAPELLVLADRPCRSPTPSPENHLLKA